jgi:hypothetical protein
MFFYLMQVRAQSATPAMSPDIKDGFYGWVLVWPAIGYETFKCFLRIQLQASIKNESTNPKSHYNNINI